MDPISLVHCGPPDGTILNLEYDGDTIINGLTYLKTNAWLLRADTINNVVFAKAGSTEFILYNFSLELGDTIHTGQLGEYHHIVTNIDSVFLNNYWHKMWYLGNFYSSHQYTVPYYVIEGMGRNKVPLFPIQPKIFQNVSKLYCFANDDGQPLVNPAVEWFDNLNSCLLDLDQLLFSKELRVYPVPVSDVMTIELPGNVKTRSIDLTDVIGRKLKNLNCIHGQNKYHLNTENTPAGVYLLKINTENGIVTKKVEIQ